MGTLAYSLTSLKKKSSPYTPTFTSTLTPIPTTPILEEVITWETFQDNTYGFKVKYPVGWELKMFTEEDTQFNVIRSGVYLLKNGYQVTIINLGRIPISGACPQVIDNEEEIIKIITSGIDLWRDKIEEGFGLINPQGGGFTQARIGDIEHYEGREIFDCMILVNDYIYQINYILPIENKEKLKNLDFNILTEMDKIISSISWAK